MKGSCLRALVLVVCTIALMSLVGMGFTVAELEYTVNHELIPEINVAAGLALGNSYAKTKTVAELEDLATHGGTIGLRTAGGVALAVLYRDKTEEELLAILTGTADPIIRAAAIEPALSYLIAKTADELKGLAATGETHEMRLAAAKAYYIKTASTATQARLEADAAGEGELAFAAGEILAGFYLFLPPVKTQAELEDIAIHGQTEGLRVAGGNALASWLIDSELTAEELQVKLAAITGTLTAEYRNAYQMALAKRFSE
jgi:hypothetical protein